VAEAILFYLFAAGVLVAGAQVIFRRNPIYGALSLVGCFFFLSGVYVLLGAHLIAILQVLVYAGAVMVLFVFVIMLLNLKDEDSESSGSRPGKGSARRGDGGGGSDRLEGAGPAFPRRAGPSGPARGQRAPGGRIRRGEGGGRTLYLASILPFEVTSLCCWSRWCRGGRGQGKI